MLDNLKRWFSGARHSAGDAGTARAIASWADQRNYSFRPVREHDGFVVDGRLGAVPWRMEWGPSQRSYVQGQELRLRAELGLASDVQALVLDRVLQEQMEKAVFDQYVEGVQTRIDNQTPPEMRWLVMFPKLAGQDLGALRERFVAIASSKNFAVQWLAGPLTEALLAAPFGAGKPLVLMISRGRLTLRTSLDEPDIDVLESWVRLFESAMREARRAAQSADAGAPSTQPSMWSASTPVDEQKA